MKVRRFDPDDDLIIVKARVFGRRSSHRLSLALDTAASHTHITPDIIDDLGYSPAEGEAITSVRSAIGKELGYTLRVKHFESLGFGVDDFLVHVHDLPPGFGIDGLLGLSFLKRFIYEIRSPEGRILVERATRPARSAAGPGAG
jgi:predicted aspartyl protease